MSVVETASRAVAANSDSKAAIDSSLKRQPEVLDEDEWTRQIESIIERDFFPDLPKLQNKLEWLKAVQSGDPVLIRQAQMNIARRRAGLKTPVGATPQDFGASVLHGSLLRTPAGLATPGFTPAQPSGQEAAGLEQEGIAQPLPSVGLDKFMATHTSEDNASFAEIMADSAKRRRLSKPWLFEEKNTRPALDGPRAVDGFGSSGQPVDGLISWPYVNKNRLYYDGAEQEALPLSNQELSLQVQGKPKQIRHANTRMPTASGPPSSTEPAASLQQPSTSASQRDMLATPAMVPGVDASPLVTWGDLEGTPLRLAEEDDLAVEALGPGPRFHLNSTPQRDQVGRRISQRATASLKRPVPPPPRFHDTPGTSGPRTSTAKPLSAAGQRLASSLRTSTPASEDAALRASYSKRTPAPTASPSPWTPRRAATPVMSPRSTPLPASHSSKQVPANLTDNLLNI
ncbi:hypothetical protein WJX73_005229 [Symbiochloris irregularis]|uniref:Uncharacterized protein n=1 Tax=Symbiochloris irregularis TaxID=706552 RepID=A0AAW1P1E9_9CHLO